MELKNFLKVSPPVQLRVMRLISILCLSGCLASLVAPAQATGRPLLTDPQTTSAASSADDTSEHVLPNGVKMVHREVRGNEVVAIQLYFRGGVRLLTEQNAGMENLLLEVATQGTRRYSKSQINRELSRMGTVVEAASGYDFSILAMRCVRSNFDRSWEILTEMVLSPLLEEKEISLVRDRLISGLRQQQDSPESAVALLAGQLFYQGHPYRSAPVGTIDSLSRLTGADLKAHHAKLLDGDRLLVVTVGSLPAEEMRRKVTASFGRLNRLGTRPGTALPSQTGSGTPRFQLIDKSVATNYIHGTFAAPPLNHPDYAAFSVTINILQQLFFQEVRVKRNLSYGADVTLLSHAANSAYVTVTTPRPNETLRVMFDQIDFLQRQLIPSEPLRAIIGGFLTQYYKKLETNDAQAARLAEYELQGGGWRRLLTWMEVTAQVTPEDIQRVSRAYLRDFHFAALGEANQFNPDLFRSR
ncbi:MAG: M16 family metallopeptidase [Blastocatellia bacterium]|jgi:zinc protease